jgi:hypothetical protein
VTLIAFLINQHSSTFEATKRLRDNFSDFFEKTLLNCQHLAFLFCRPEVGNGLQNAGVPPAGSMWTSSDDQKANSANGGTAVSQDETISPLTFVTLWKRTLFPQSRSVDDCGS